MAKISKADAQTAWRDAESRYQEAIARHLDVKNSGKIDKDDAVSITKMRVKADKHMDTYLHHCLG